MQLSDSQFSCSRTLRWFSTTHAEVALVTGTACLDLNTWPQDTTWLQRRVVRWVLLLKEQRILLVNLFVIFEACWNRESLIDAFILKDMAKGAHCEAHV